jgi:hypothetical protein
VLQIATYADLYPINIVSHFWQARSSLLLEHSLFWIRILRVDHCGYCPVPAQPK